VPAAGSSNVYFYVLLPLAAMLLAWGIGTFLHIRAVRADTAAYPYHGGTMKVWLPPVIASIICLLVPTGIFLWMAFGADDVTAGWFAQYQQIAVGMMLLATVGTAGFFALLSR